MRHAALLAVAPVLFAISPAFAGDPLAKPAALKACVEPAPTATIRASFGATVSLRDLVTWVAGFTCKPVVYPTALDRVAARVTIVVPATGLTPAKAMSLFVEAVHAAGVIVTIKPDAISLKLDPNAPVVKPASALAAAADTGDVDPDIWQTLVDTGAQLDDPTHARITRVLVEALLAYPATVAKGARIVPSMKNGVANGFKLYAIRPSSLFAKIGISNGDTIVKLNGAALDAADALDAYTKLSATDHFAIEIIRRGKTMTIEIDVVDAL